MPLFPEMLQVGKSKVWGTIEWSGRQRAYPPAYAPAYPPAYLPQAVAETKSHAVVRRLLDVMEPLLLFCPELRDEIYPRGQLYPGNTGQGGASGWWSVTGSYCGWGPCSYTGRRGLWGTCGAGGMGSIMGRDRSRGRSRGRRWCSDGAAIHGRVDGASSSRFRLQESESCSPTAIPGEVVIAGLPETRGAGGNA